MKRRRPTVKEARRPTTFLRVCEGWRIFAVEDHYADGTPVRYEFILSPEQKVYRHASSWEIPTLVIDADILPPEHHIRLVRITSKKEATRIRKALRKQDRRLRKN